MSDETHSTATRLTRLRTDNQGSMGSMPNYWDNNTNNGQQSSQNLNNAFKRAPNTVKKPFFVRNSRQSYYGQRPSIGSRQMRKQGMIQDEPNAIRLDTLGNSTTSKKLLHNNIDKEHGKSAVELQ